MTRRRESAAERDERIVVEVSRWAQREWDEGFHVLSPALAPLRGEHPAILRVNAAYRLRWNRAVHAAARILNRLARRKRREGR